MFVLISFLGMFVFKNETYVIDVVLLKQAFYQKINQHNFLLHTRRDMDVTHKCVDLYHCSLGGLPYKVSRNPCDRTYSPHGVVFLRLSVCANGIAPLPAGIS